MQDINYKHLELQAKYYNLLHEYIISNFYHKKTLLISQFINNDLRNIDDLLVYDTKYQIIHKENSYLIAYCDKLGLTILDNNLDVISTIFKKPKEFSDSYLNFIKD